MTSTDAPEVVPTLPVAAPGYCQCGCGAQVRRRYRPGHDAKHKSLLLAVASQPITSASAPQVRQAVLALDALSWAAYAPAEALDLVKPTSRYRGRFVATHHIWSVELFHIDPDGQHHSNPACPACVDSCRSHDRSRSLAPGSVGSLLTRWGFLRSGALRTSTQIEDGWAICPYCIHEETFRERVTRTHVARILTLAAIADAPISAPPALPIPALPPVSTPSPLPVSPIYPAPPQPLHQLYRSIYEFLASRRSA